MSVDPSVLATGEQAAGESSTSAALLDTPTDTSTETQETVETQAEPSTTQVTDGPSTETAETLEAADETPTEEVTEPVAEAEQSPEQIAATELIERLGGQERVQLIEQLAQPGLDGKQGAELLKQIAPWNEPAISEELAWEYLENEQSQEVIAQEILGVSAETAKALAQLYKDGRISDEDLQAEPETYLSEADRQAVEEARQIKRERDEEKKTQEIAKQQETQKQIGEAYQEIFKSTLAPINELKTEFKFAPTPEDNKNPEVKSLKEIASRLYDLYALGLVEADPNNKQVNEHLQQVLSQGLGYKDQARSRYAPDLTRRTRAAAARAAQDVNKLLTAALRGVQSEITQKTKAPIEPAGHGSGMGNGNGTREKMPEPGTPEFERWATRGFNVAVSTNSPKI